MSLKRQPLDADAFAIAAVPQPDPVQAAITGSTHFAKARPQSRRNKVQIQGYFVPITRRRLKMLAIEQGRTVEDLLGEAIADASRSTGHHDGGTVRQCDCLPSAPPSREELAKTRAEFEELAANAAPAFRKTLEAMAARYRALEQKVAT